MNKPDFNILLVEDNPTDVMIMREALSNAKFNVGMYTAEDGVLAIQFLRKEGIYAEMPRPDLILLDLNMPRKNGLEVLLELKTDASLKSIPIVMLTTSNADDDVAQAYRANVNCYIRKPVDFEQFVHIIKNIEEFWFTIVSLPGN